MNHVIIADNTIQSNSLKGIELKSEITLETAHGLISD